MAPLTPSPFAVALTSLALLVASAAFAATEQRPTVWDLGVLALATHDLRAQPGERDLTNVEDSRLNLSTLYESTDDRGIDVLGHRKNTFNTITTSVCRHFADYHFAAVAKLKAAPGGRTPAQVEAEARRRTVEYYLRSLAGSFERVTGLEFPRQPIEGDLDNSETIALLLGHDLLPGRIAALDADGRPVDRDGDGQPDQHAIADRSLDEHVLNMAEMQEPVPGFDGVYDPAFLAFKRKGDGVTLNLREIDRMVVGFLDATFDFLDTTPNHAAARMPSEPAKTTR